MSEPTETYVAENPLSDVPDPDEPCPKCGAALSIMTNGEFNTRRRFFKKVPFLNPKPGELVICRTASCYWFGLISDIKEAAWYDEFGATYE